jgi:hypothetical protein
VAAGVDASGVAEDTVCALAEAEESTVCGDSSDDAILRLITCEELVEVLRGLTLRTV